MKICLMCFKKKREKKGTNLKKKKNRIKIIMIDLYVEKDILHKNPAF